MRGKESPFRWCWMKTRSGLRHYGGLALNGDTASYIRHTFSRYGKQIWISVIMGRIVNADCQEVIQAIFTDMTDIKQLELEQEGSSS